MTAAPRRPVPITELIADWTLAFLAVESELNGKRPNMMDDHRAEWFANSRHAATVAAQLVAGSRRR